MAPGLTYRSAQDAHKHDGFYRELADRVGISFEEAKSLLA